MNKYLFIILLGIIAYCSTSCNNTPAPVAKNDNLDTLVSDHFLDDGEYQEEPEIIEEPEPIRTTPARKYTSSGGGGNGGGGSDSEVFVQKYQNFERGGSHPDDFAEAMIYPAIRMVYSDNFLNPKARVLNSTMEGDNHVIELAISWKDHWTPKYEIQGTLTVAEDGSNPKFVISKKNMEAEVLELTEDDFKNELTLDAL